MSREPEVCLADYGRHILWSHECITFVTNGSGTWEQAPEWVPDVMLPISTPNGWTVESTEPLTVSPSILCGLCGTHGFWRDGRWVAA